MAREDSLPFPRLCLHAVDLFFCHEVAFFFLNVNSFYSETDRHLLALQNTKLGLHSIKKNQYSNSRELSIHRAHPMDMQSLLTASDLI